MLPKRLFDAVYERDRAFCLLALSGCMGEGTVLDHRANRQMGGSGGVLDDPVNLVLACGFCNSAKEDSHEMVRTGLRERGLIVRPHATHRKTLERVRLTPVEYLDGERFYLLSSRDERGRWTLGRLHESELVKETV